MERSQKQVGNWHGVGGSSRNHWLCPLASSPRGCMRATRRPMSPVGMTTSRVTGVCPLRSCSWEPPLCPPSEELPPCFLGIREPGVGPPKPGAMGRLSGLQRLLEGHLPHWKGSHSLITARARGTYLQKELGNERDTVSRASKVRCEEIRLLRMGFQTPCPL